MAVTLEGIIDTAIDYVKQATFFEDGNIPVEPIYLPDQVYDFGDNEIVGVGLPTGSSLYDPEAGQFSSGGGGPIPTAFEAEMILVVKSVGEDGVTTLHNRLFPVSTAALAAIFGQDLNPDTADTACSIWAYPPVKYEVVPFPGYRGDKGPALIIWTFRVQVINLEL